MFFVINESVSVIGTLGAVLASISIFPLVISIFPVEKALEKNFRENGKEINKLNKND
jgi:hypothetical protein